MSRSAALFLVLQIVVCANPARAQTVSDWIWGDQETYSFHTEASGQYEATLTWDKYDASDVLALSLLCNDETGAPVTHGVALGSRARIVRLNVGLRSEKECFISVHLIDGSSAEYTLNLAATSPLVISKASREGLPASTGNAIGGIGDRLRSMFSSRVGKAGLPRSKDTPTHTVLEQVRGGAPRTFAFDVLDAGLLQLTAMWNRADTDLRLSLVCSDETTSVDFGRSESGQERFLRFDTEIPPDTACVVTAASPATMVYALNIALYGDGDLAVVPPPPPACTPRSQCCKVCVAGKACGDSCINRSYTCTKPPGCACNASEVCS